MLLLKIKDVPFKVNGLMVSVLTIVEQMFPASKDYKQITEGGMLDGTTFRVDKDGHVWVRGITNQDTPKTGELEIVIKMDPNGSSAVIADIREVIRKVRNWCETIEYTSNSTLTVFPFIAEYSSDEELHSDIHDELAKIMVPTIGFSKRNYTVDEAEPVERPIAA